MVQCIGLVQIRAVLIGGRVQMWAVWGGGAAVAELVDGKRAVPIVHEDVQNALQTLLEHRLNNRNVQIHKFGYLIPLEELPVHAHHLVRTKQVNRLSVEIRIPFRLFAEFEAEREDFCLDENGFSRARPAVATILDPNPEVFVVTG